MIKIQNILTFIIINLYIYTKLEFFVDENVILYLQAINITYRLKIRYL